jgi:hypothetical protein
MKELHKALLEVKASGDRVRKGTYAGINELRKMIVEMHSDLEILKRNICK